MLAIQKRGQRHGTLYELVFLIRQKCLGARVVQCAENLLVVHNVSRKAADERYFAGAHGIDELLRFVPMLNHVVCHAAAPNSVNAVAFAVCKRLAIELQFAHVSHHTWVSFSRKLIREQVKLINYTIFQVVANGKMRMRNAVFGAFVNVDEAVDPVAE